MEDNILIYIICQPPIFEVISEYLDLRSCIQLVRTSRKLSEWNPLRECERRKLIKKKKEILAAYMMKPKRRFLVPLLNDINDESLNAEIDGIIHNDKRTITCGLFLKYKSELFSLLKDVFLKHKIRYGDIIMVNQNEWEFVFTKNGFIRIQQFDWILRGFVDLHIEEFSLLTMLDSSGLLIARPFDLQKYEDQLNRNYNNETDTSKITVDLGYGIRHDYGVKFVERTDSSFENLEDILKYKAFVCIVDYNSGTKTLILSDSLAIA